MPPRKKAEAVQVQPDESTPVVTGAAPKPSLGRIVLYTTVRNAPRAAIISGVQEDTVTLHVFNVHGALQAEEIPFSEEPKEGHWSWPPRD